MGTHKIKLIDTIYVHHSASPRDTTTAFDILQWHLDKKWRTAGYQAIIQGNGAIYRLRSERQVGAHVRGHNRRALGVCVCGNFERETPNEIQLRKLRGVLSDWLKSYELTRGNNGSGVYSPNIKGHRDEAATLCPGKNLYFPLIAEIIPDLTASLNAGLLK